MYHFFKQGKMVYISNCGQISFVFVSWRCEKAAAEQSGWRPTTTATVVSYLLFRTAVSFFRLDFFRMSQKAWSIKPTFVGQG